MLSTLFILTGGFVLGFMTCMFLVAMISQEVWPAANANVRRAYKEGRE